MKMRNSLLAAAAIALLAGVAAPSFAEPYDNNEIVVVPYGVQREVTGRSATGARIETRSLSRVVTTEGLDLRYDAAVDELHRRIEYTARASCEELDRSSFDLQLTSDRQCVNEAVRDAMPQADIAVARARTYASLK